MRPDGLMIVNVSDHIRKGQAVQVVDWHVKAITSIGLLLIDKIPVKTPRLRFGANRDVRVSVEWILVFLHLPNVPFLLRHYAERTPC